MKTSYGMTKREIAAKNYKPDLASLHGWLKYHRTHGKPFRDAKIGVYFTWRCSCSEAFKFTEDERTDQPIRFNENEPE